MGALEVAGPLPVPHLSHARRCQSHANQLTKLGAGRVHLSVGVGLVGNEAPHLLARSPVVTAAAHRAYDLLLAYLAGQNKTSAGGSMKAQLVLSPACLSLAKLLRAPPSTKLVAATRLLLITSHCIAVVSCWPLDRPHCALGARAPQ